MVISLDFGPVKLDDVTLGCYNIIFKTIIQFQIFTSQTDHETNNWDPTQSQN